ncbi:IS3 family transposase [uncultured Nitrosomonas sp.]|uniref:IS3 family transposase n=1 Tax=uncultured Nitrosomonas sp. TaxID=156424 RepID=UPI0034596D7C
MCVLHSGYYDWAKRAPSQRAVTNSRLIEQIMVIYRTSDCTYGRPRITVELADRGVRVNERPRPKGRGIRAVRCGKLEKCKLPIFV